MGLRSEAGREASRPERAERGPYWLFGRHAVVAAVANPERRVRRLLITQDEERAKPAPRAGPDHPAWERVTRDEMAKRLPPGSVHQGIAALVEPLRETPLADVLARAAKMERATLLILDQVTDPQNVGAILRSAAAFGALCVVLTERHGAPETGALAKAASGALDVVPLVRVVNLARAMEEVKRAGFWIAGLAADAPGTLAQAKLTGRIAVALGSEGAGLRRLTRDYCDLMASLPTGGPIDQLNVANAAAVALYELNRR